MSIHSKQVYSPDQSIQNDSEDTSTSTNRQTMEALQTTNTQPPLPGQPSSPARQSSRPAAQNHLDIESSERKSLNNPPTQGNGMLNTLRAMATRKNLLIIAGGALTAVTVSVALSSIGENAPVESPNTTWTGEIPTTGNLNTEPPTTYNLSQGDIGFSDRDDYTG